MCPLRSCILVTVGMRSTYKECFSSTKRRHVEKRIWFEQLIYDWCPLRLDAN
jgi:hypothetical protein